jgi:hypothetical protein
MNGIACWAWCLCERVCASGHTRTKAPPLPSESVPKLIQSARKRQSAGRAAATTAAAAAPLYLKEPFVAAQLMGAPRRSPGANQGRAARESREFFRSPRRAIIHFSCRCSHFPAATPLVRYLAVLQMPKGHTHTLHFPHCQAVFVDER